MPGSPGSLSNHFISQLQMHRSKNLGLRSTMSALIVLRSDSHCRESLSGNVHRCFFVWCCYRGKCARERLCLSVWLCVCVCVRACAYALHALQCTTFDSTCQNNFQILQGHWSAPLVYYEISRPLSLATPTGTNLLTYLNVYDVYTYFRICMCVYVCIHMCVCIYIYMYIVRAPKDIIYIGISPVTLMKVIAQRVCCCRYEYLCAMAHKYVVTSYFDLICFYYWKQ